MIELQAAAKSFRSAGEVEIANRLERLAAYPDAQERLAKLDTNKIAQKIMAILDKLSIKMGPQAFARWKLVKGKFTAGALIMSLSFIIGAICAFLCFVWFGGIGVLGVIFGTTLLTLVNGLLNILIAAFALEASVLMVKEAVHLFKIFLKDLKGEQDTSAYQAKFLASFKKIRAAGHI